MMRYVFGEDAYRRVISYYLNQHAYGSVETNDLYQAFQDVLGMSPSWFFEEWIYRGGEPHYAVSYDDLINREGERETIITLHQEQATDDMVKLFTMPLVFEVHYRDGSVDRVRQTIARESERVVIPNSRKQDLAFVLCDPGSWIAKQLSFPKSYTELAAQVIGAPEMIDRYDALRALSTTPPAAKKALLINVFSRERFHALKAEVVTQLAMDESAESRGLVEKAIRDPDVEVRAAALHAYRQIPPALQSAFERLITDSSYALAADALEQLCMQFPDRRTTYLSWTKDESGVGNQIAVIRFRMNASSGNRPALDSLVDMAGPSFEFRTRLNALEALRSLNYLDSTLVLHLCDAATHWNGRLRGPATDIAASMLQQQSHRALFTAVVQRHSWQPRQRELLNKLLGVE
jgi:hypothetical protein